MPKVSKCMCEECKYNESYECTAQGIEVRSMGDMQVQSSEGTMCTTFAPKRGTENYPPTRL